MPPLLSPSDVSDQEWAVLAPLLPPAKPGGRPRSVDLRQILTGIFSVVPSRMRLADVAWRVPAK